MGQVGEKVERRLTERERKKDVDWGRGRRMNWPNMSNFKYSIYFFYPKREG